jgi:hypothetical protein
MLTGLNARLERPSVIEESVGPEERPARTRKRVENAALWLHRRLRETRVWPSPTVLSPPPPGGSRDTTP